jgi:hypothetical protein
MNRHSCVEDGASLVRIVQEGDVVFRCLHAFLAGKLDSPSEQETFVRTHNRLIGDVFFGSDGSAKLKNASQRTSLLLRNGGGMILWKRSLCNTGFFVFLACNYGKTPSFRASGRMLPAACCFQLWSGMWRSTSRHKNIECAYDCCLDNALE